MKYKIVIIEDNSNIRNNLIEALSDNFHVKSAADGIKGLDLIREFEPHIAIIDILMPKLNGIEMLKKIKELNISIETYFIFLTALIDDDNKYLGLELGAIDFMYKPFSLKEIILKCNNIISKINNVKIKNNTENYIKEYNINYKNTDREFVEKVKNYIKINLTNNKLNIKEISKELNVSTSTFERRFFKNFNITAKAYIRDSRLEKSITLIKAGHLDISQLSYSLGFNSVAYFCKCFKDKYKVSPKKVLSSTNLIFNE